MKKLQKIKYITIAAGILLSAAFYIHNGGMDYITQGNEESLFIGEEADGSNDSGLGSGKSEISWSSGKSWNGGNNNGGDGNKASESGSWKNGSGDAPAAVTDAAAATDDADSFSQSLLSKSFADRLEEELYIGNDGRGYISDELKQELRTAVREAVREELTAMCEQGYLEQAVTEAKAYAAAEAERKAGMVNINTADVKELMTLDGIGEKRAGDIVSYRDAHGGFKSIEDIMQVSGIKQSSYDKIKDKIYV